MCRVGILALCNKSKYDEVLIRNNPLSRKFLNETPVLEYLITSICDIYNPYAGAVGILLFATCKWKVINMKIEIISFVMKVRS